MGAVQALDASVGNQTLLWALLLAKEPVVCCHKSIAHMLLSSLFPRLLESANQWTILYKPQLTALSPASSRECSRPSGSYCSIFVATGRFKTNDSSRGLCDLTWLCEWVVHGQITGDHGCAVEDTRVRDPCNADVQVRQRRNEPWSENRIRLRVCGR